MRLEHGHGQQRAGPRQFLVVTEQRDRIVEQSLPGQEAIAGTVVRLVVDREAVGRGVGGTIRAR